MKNFYNFAEFLNENYISINESFLSNTLAQFVATFPNKLAYAKLPNGIQWNLIPEDEVIAGSSMNPDFKKSVANDEYVVFWFNDTKQLVKYKEPTYYKNKPPKENSTYINDNFVFLTRGFKFLTNTRDINNARTFVRTAENTFPLSSVKQVFDELTLSAIAIKWATLMEYSSKEILKLRREQKEGAVALQKVQDVLNQNKRRYEEYVQTAKVEKGTRDLTLKTEEKMNSIKEQMSKLSSVTVHDLFNTKFADWKEDRFGSLQYNREYAVKLEELANKYNEISYAFANYIIFFRKNSYNNGGYYKQEVEDYTKELINLLK